MLLHALRRSQVGHLARLTTAYSAALSRKVIITMKLLILFTLALCLQATAKGYSQQITLSENGTPLEQVLKKIKKQSGFYFIYANEHLRGAKPVSISVRQVSLLQAL